MAGKAPNAAVIKFPRKESGNKPGPKPKKETAPSGNIWAIGGGKGGVGKSLLTSSLGIAMAQRGKKVVLIDADLGGANLHTCLGIPQPKTSLTDFINRSVENLEDVILESGIENLQLISGAYDVLGAANPKYQQKMRLIREIRKLDVDLVLLDLGSGTNFNILDFFLISDIGIMMMLPEPTSLENIYRFIKAAFFRKLRQIIEHHNIRQVIDEAMNFKGERGIKTPYELIGEVSKIDSNAGDLIREELGRFYPKLVVNQVRNEDDARVGVTVRTTCSYYLGIDIDYVGYIPYDDMVWQSVKTRQPLLINKPDTMAARGIQKIVNGLISPGK